jgi:hypothetical protein
MPLSPGHRASLRAPAGDLDRHHTKQGPMASAPLLLRKVVPIGLALFGLGLAVGTSTNASGGQVTCHRVLTGQQSATAEMQACATTPATGSSSALVPGVNIHLLSSDANVLNTALDATKAAHLSWVRVDVDLRSTPAAGQLDRDKVAAMDSLVTQASARGLRVLFTLKNTPRWESSGPRDPWPHPADFGAVAGLMAAHFKGRVGAWELWNEPNISTFMTPPDPVAYTKMVQSAYVDIKAADSAALVVVSDTSYVDTGYVQAEYAAGLAGSFDVMGVHPYNRQCPPSQNCDLSSTRRGLGHLPDLEALMVAKGDGAKPVWATEWGFNSDKIGTQAQADNDVAQLKAFANAYPFVAAQFVYQMRAGCCSPGFGLLNADLSPRPAYSALQTYLGSP